ncbi:MAG: C-terminal target protein [Flavipsychrobacter sp.]|jgi:hypothetical protein|nr:C-terminal target protein [Flavipsychrobacter sp.]
MKKLNAYPKSGLRSALMTSFLLFGMALFLTQNVYAQATTAAAYNFTRLSGPYTSIAVGGTASTILADDVVETGIPIGFSFTYCGSTTTVISACSNSWISLSNDATVGSLSASTGSVSAGKLFPFWGDNHPGPGGTAWYQTTGTPGSRVFTFEWTNWNRFGQTTGLDWNFQVKLFEGSNNIQFCYGPRAALGVSNRTIGIGNSTTDFLTLPSGSSTTANSTFNTGCDLPAGGTILTFSPLTCPPGGALPAPVAMTGGGGYCLGGTGVNVGLAGSAVGINYQLYLGGTPVGSPVAGVGAGFSFGLQTAAGVYTATATNPSTGCTSNMLGSKTVIIYPLPNLHTVTGGGNYCSGGIGVPVGLGTSDIGVNYILHRGGLPVVGATVAGTGGAILFPLQTIAGTYTVVAKMAGFTGCTQLMTGSAVVTVDPLPSVFSVTGGGSYCAGGAGMAVGLSNSNTGINYQLYRGTTAVGTPVAGTGSAISFGSQTVVGTYTVKATNTTTGCLNNMFGSVAVNLLPAPVVYTVTGGGGYCSGAAGANVGLSGSTGGVNYQLFLGGSPVGSPVAGTGSVISFGPQSAAGTYTVVATNASSSCTSNMSGSVVVSVNSLPNAYTVTGGGLFCAGGAGVPIGLASSDAGVNYQLYRGTMTIGGPVGGTGSAITFGNHNIAGTYTVKATIVATGCTQNMTGSVTITINPLPAPITMTGGGGYCTGGSGVAIGLAASATGISYQLYLGATPVGSPVTGTGGAISFGLQTTAGTYTAMGTDLTTGCTNLMTGSKTVIIYSLPAAFTVTGGGSYCSGGSGVAIGLAGSQTGTSYQLYRGGLPVVGAVVTGTGSAIVFPMQTIAGTYTVVATVAGPSACMNTMTGSVTVSVNPLPTVYTVTGGSYCSGGTGGSINVAGSDVGVNYQLYLGLTAVGSPMAGTGSAISFTSLTSSGTYTVKGTNTTTGCINTMGSAAIVINPLPFTFSVTGGGSYCPGGTGRVVGLSGTTTGIMYQLYLSGSPVGSPVAGTGAAISFGLQTATGTYTVIGTNTTTSCSNTMAGSATVSVAALPTAYTVTGGGGYCAGGTGVTVGLASSSTATQYQLFRGATAVGAPVSGTGFALSFGLHTIAGTYTVVATSTGTLCSNTMTGSVTVTVNPLPTVDTVNGGGAYCAGGTGVSVGLNNSNSGVNYQLYRGTTAVGSPVSGTGAAITFGAQTVAGTYTVKAANPTTGCLRTMAGSATVTIIATPLAYTVTGGGGYCSGGSGVPVYLSGSQAGVNYELYVGATPSGAPMAGTGAALSFGLKTTAGTYTVIAASASGGCTATMTGSVNVTVNTAPVAYTVTGGGSYCSGSTGVTVGLASSDAGVNYQLYRGTATVGSPVAGTGSAISFGAQTVNGTYTVKGTSTTGGCMTNMTGSVGVTVNVLPAPVSVTGGGGYCSGGAGVAVGLAGSGTGVSYQLYLSGSPVGSPVTGAGGAVSFGLQTAAGVYTVVATNGAGCTSTMSGSATVYVYANPSVYTVSGGGGYCTGTTGVHIYLSGSNTGISYKLFRNGTPTYSMSGTGSSLDFGLYTTAGTYSVTATASGTGCVSAMSGSVVVTVNPLPVVTGSIYTMMPGGSITLTSSISGGTYASNNTAVATVGSTSGIVSGVSLGTVVISYTAPTGCVGTRICYVTPTGFRPGSSATTTAVTNTEISVSPNPSKGIFTVKGTFAEAVNTDVTILVTDMAGRTIHTAQAVAQDGNLNESINLGNVASGMYLLNVKTNNDHKVFHVVVEQ